MKKGRITAVLFVVVFLLVMAVCVNLLVDMQAAKKDADTPPSPTAAPTAAPTPMPTPEPTPAPTPLPTPEPYYTEAPAPSPSLVPIPTPAPQTEGDFLCSGEFMSETGVPINVRAEWEAEVLDENRVLVTVDVYLESYQLHITEAVNSVNVSVGDSYASADSPTIDWDNNMKLDSLLAATAHTLELPVGYSSSFPVQVEYHFGGVYSGVELPVIECGGTITISR